MTTKKRDRSNEQGNILVAALLVMLMMNLLAVGLVQSSVREIRTASYQEVDNSTFHATESCNRSAISWLGEQIRPSEEVPYEIAEDDIMFMALDGEDENELSHLEGYSYDCMVDELISKSVSADDEGVGKEVGTYSGYGQTGDMAPRFYYQINANGQGPKNSSRATNMIVSVEF